MFKKNTLLILGAGASHDLHFPLGRKFKEDIADITSFQRNTTEDGYGFEIELQEPSDSEFERLARAYISNKTLTDNRLAISDDAIRRAMQMIAAGVGFAPSIDVFLKMRSQETAIVLCSKVAIASLILKCEQRAQPQLVPSDNLNWRPSLEKTWYQAFCEICFSDTEGQDQISEALSRISIVSFNYDRCIEQLVRSAIERLYSLPRSIAGELAGKMRVLHPYGSLGPLPVEAGDVGVAFGASIDTIDVNQMIDGIKTFNEQSEIRSEIQAEVAKSEQIIFLGFGFHKPNLDLLRQAGAGSFGTRRIYGTAMNFADTAIESMIPSLQAGFSTLLPGGVYPAAVNLKNVDCTMLLDDYRGELIDQ
jgi:hypothetical protein